MKPSAAVTVTPSHCFPPRRYVTSLYVPYSFIALPPPPRRITTYPRRNRVYCPSLRPNRASGNRTVPKRRAPIVRPSVHLAAFIFRPNEIESPANGTANGEENNGSETRLKRKREKERAGVTRCARRHLAAVDAFFVRVLQGERY